MSPASLAEPGLGVVAGPDAEPAPEAHDDAPLSADQADLLALASVMLGYPDDRLCQSRARLADALAGLPASPAKSHLARFADWWLTMPPAELRQIYVATFDSRRGCSLDVTYSTCGDQRTRGQALHDVLSLFHSAGLEPATEELPDHLPTICQFAAMAPPPAARQALQVARAAAQGIHQGLAKQHSGYEPVLRRRRKRRRFEKTNGFKRRSRRCSTIVSFSSKKH